MKTFSEYLKIRENEDNQEPSSLNPTESGNSSALFRMIRLAWKAHNSETNAFFKKLASFDPEIAEEYQRLDDSDLALPNRKKDSDQDEIRPPSADTGSGLNGDEQSD